MYIHLSSLELCFNSLKQLDLHALSYSLFTTTSTPSALIRDQLFCSKDLTANRTMSANKVHVKDGLEGSSTDRAIPDSPFIDIDELTLKTLQMTSERK